MAGSSNFFPANKFQSLSLDDDKDVVIDAPIVDAEPINHSLYMVGKLITNRRINYSAMKATLSGIWQAGRGVSISEVDDKVFLLQKKVFPSCGF